MALSASLRHRRSLTTTVSSLLRSISSSSSPLSTPSPFSLSSSSATTHPHTSAVAPIQFRSFRSSSAVLSSQARQYKPYQEGDEIGPDTILFEGCDYNHWLITMEFPKDPKPSPEEMVRTYEETCARGLGISIEEARRKMYACSTTTYQGFQALMTEEESEKFRDLPGVVFILPDSYIDPVNKEYGGDKYENGMITHRPPPVQYGRNNGGRFRDRNRNPDQSRFNQRDENQQGNPNQQGPMQGDRRNYGPPPNQQNFDPRQNNPPQQNFRPQQDYPPQQQQNFRPQQNYPPQQNFAPPQNSPPQQNSGPQQNYPLRQQNYSPPQQNSGPQQNYPPPQQNSGPQQNYPPPQQNSGPQQNYPPQQRYDPAAMNNRDFATGGRNGYQAENMNQRQPGGYGQGRQNYPAQGGQDYPGQGGPGFSHPE